MKIFLYCPDTGIYQGEDFSNVPFMGTTSDTVPYSTVIEPPATPKGMVPVFLPEKGHWEICAIESVLRTDAGKVPASGKTVDKDVTMSHFPGDET